MNLKKFETLAANYGGDIDSWPSESIDAARNFLKTHPEAEIVLQAHNKLDHVLSTQWNVGFSESLQQKIVSAAADRQPVKKSQIDKIIEELKQLIWQRPVVNFSMAMVLVVSLAFGFVSTNDGLFFETQSPLLSDFLEDEVGAL